MANTAGELMLHLKDGARLNMLDPKTPEKLVSRLKKMKVDQRVDELAGGWAAALAHHKKGRQALIDMVVPMSPAQQTKVWSAPGVIKQISSDPQDAHVASNNIVLLNPEQQAAALSAEGARGTEVEHAVRIIMERIERVKQAMISYGGIPY